MTLLGLFVGTVAYAFRCLRVVDEGDVLTVRYGTLPVFYKHFRYADIVGAEQDRSSFIDGWGIHWVPWRGGRTTCGASTACGSLSRTIALYESVRTTPRGSSAFSQENWGGTPNGEPEHVRDRRHT